VKLEEAIPSAHLELMRLLEQHPDYSQRQLAVAMGVSLGKTHYILKALLSKGWVKAQNFGRNTNKLGYLYQLTPRGITHRFQLTQTFLRRKEQQYLLLSAEIALLKAELASRAADS
jgi:EPS-associated MarR family transcriptional regulator